MATAGNPAPASSTALALIDMRAQMVNGFLNRDVGDAERQLQDNPKFAGGPWFDQLSTVGKAEVLRTVEKHSSTRDVVDTIYHQVVAAAECYDKLKEQCKNNKTIHGKADHDGEIRFWESKLRTRVFRFCM